MFLSWSELRTHSCGAVEIAFDHENSDIIVESNSAAELCRAAEDIGHEAFCGQRRTASYLCFPNKKLRISSKSFPYHVKGLLLGHEVSPKPFVAAFTIVDS